MQPAPISRRQGQVGSFTADFSEVLLGDPVPVLAPTDVEKHALNHNARSETELHQLRVRSFTEPICQ